MTSDSLPNFRNVTESLAFILRENWHWQDFTWMPLKTEELKMEEVFFILISWTKGRSGMHLKCSNPSAPRIKNTQITSYFISHASLGFCRLLCTQRRISNPNKLLIRDPFPNKCYMPGQGQVKRQSRGRERFEQWKRKPCSYEPNSKKLLSNISWWHCTRLVLIFSSANDW